MQQSLKSGLDLASDILCVQYISSMKDTWDNFLKRCKNAPFFIRRDFMEYHADRYLDYSLVFISRNKVVAIFPANIIMQQEAKHLYSHQGITYGGLYYDECITLPVVLQVYSALIQHLASNDFTKVYFKRTPHIYHEYPSGEDEYCLHFYGAKLLKVEPNSVISLDRRLGYSKLRRRSLSKASTYGYRIEKVFTYEVFWDILTKNLHERYAKSPVHTLSEIQRLAANFPENIKLYMAYDSNSKPQAGIVIFESQTVSHMQYISCTEIGRETGALDFLINTLIELYKDTKKFLSFGISSENDGSYINQGLLSYKEGFGARTISNLTYELSIGNIND